MTENQQDATDRVIERLIRNLGIIGLMIVCGLGFGLASWLLSVVLLGLYWLLSRPIAWLWT